MILRFFDKFCVSSILNELFTNNDKSTVKFFMNIKTQTMGLLSRFLIIESEALLPFIQKSWLRSIRFGSFYEHVFVEHELY